MSFSQSNSSQQCDVTASQMLFISALTSELRFHPIIYFGSEFVPAMMQTSTVSD
jgi:hypothetical protein